MNNQTKKKLKALAHHLNPIVIIGQNGLTDSVQLEIERGLLDHELIKIKINAGDQVARKTMIKSICAERYAELIQTIGHVAVIYRKNPE